MAANTAGGYLLLEKQQFPLDLENNIIAVFYRA